MPPAAEDHGQRHHRQSGHGDPQPEPAALIPPATSVSHGVRAWASGRRIQVLVWSSTRSQGVCAVNRNAQATITIASTSQAVVLTLTGCGSGGGAPLAGRSLRRDVARRGGRRNGALGVLAHRTPPPRRNHSARCGILPSCARRPGSARSPTTRDPAARNAVPKNNSVQEGSASSSCMAVRIASHGRRMIH